MEESDKANGALFGVFPVMVLVMFTLLMAQVQNFAKALSGVRHLTAGLDRRGACSCSCSTPPFGFVSMLGVIALAGMDMRNSIILIDQIEQDKAAGVSAWEAVIGATVRRSRPVVLTAATAILAMFPLTRSVFWGPMAVAIMGGLSLATFLTLINLPAVLYVLLFRVKQQSLFEMASARDGDVKWNSHRPLGISSQQWRRRKHVEQMVQGEAAAAACPHPAVVGRSRYCRHCSNSPRLRWD